MNKQELKKGFEKESRRFVEDIYKTMIENFLNVSMSLDLGLNEQIKLGEHTIAGHRHNGTLTFTVRINGGCKNGKEYI